MKKNRIPLLLSIAAIVLNSCKKEEFYIPTVNVSVYETGLEDGESLTKIIFVNSNVGFVSTTNGKILKTTDQGSTWTTLTVAGSGVVITEISAPSDQVIFASGESSFDNYLYKSVDGGATWQEIAGNYEFVSTNFPSLNTGYMINLGNFYKSTNGGVFWNSVNSLYDAFDPHTIEFCSLDTGIVIDFDGEIYRTTDGGDNFTQIYIGSTYSIRAARFISKSVGYAVNYQSGVYKTTDAGETWFELLASSDSYGMDYNTTAIDAMGNTIVAVGDGTMLISKDGGNNFKNYFNQEGTNTGSFDIKVLSENKAIGIYGNDIFTITF